MTNNNDNLFNSNNKGEESTNKIDWFDLFLQSMVNQSKNG